MRSTLLIWAGLVTTLAATWWAPHPAPDDYETVLAASRALEIEFDRFHRQTQAGDLVIDRVACGRLSLTAAADELTEINVHQPSFMVGLAASYPGAAPRERVARFVVKKADRRAAGDTTWEHTIRPQLECEFAAAFPDAAPLADRSFPRCEERDQVAGFLVGEPVEQAVGHE